MKQQKPWISIVRKNYIPRKFLCIRYVVCFSDTGIQGTLQAKINKTIFWHHRVDFGHSLLLHGFS